MVTQVITIVNQSGKVVKTSKTLVNVFKEAKSAYAERKAELNAIRVQKNEEKETELDLRRKVEVTTVADDISRASSRRGSEDGRHKINRKPVPQRERPRMERGFSDSFYANDDVKSTKSGNRPTPPRFDSAGQISTGEPRSGELVRRHTSGIELHERRSPRTPTRSASADNIDMDLAYGYLPPPLPDRRNDAALEIREKMTALQRLLEECNCLQHSAVATIDNLQKNPDALAAVALTLAEISSLATKLAPGALMSMKGAFPAIIALLASPQFAIAAGVGVGVTIIAFGSYKIIKKIQAKKENARLIEPGGPASLGSSVDELREINHIDVWRRGIEPDPPGTSVDGEFVTPAAGRTLIEEGRLRESDLKSTVSRKSRKVKEKEKEKKAESEVGSSRGGKRKVKVKKDKEPSGLRMLFSGHAKA